MRRAISRTGSTILRLTTGFFEQRELGTEILAYGSDVRASFLHCARWHY